MPEIIDIILSRRSIRQFTAEPVGRETLVLLLKAAMAAPTACNSQPWEFIAVTEQETLDLVRSRIKPLKESRTQYDEHKVYWQCYEPRKRRPKTKNAKYLP